MSEPSLMMGPQSRRTGAAVFKVPRNKGARAWENAGKNIGVSSLEGDNTLRSIVHKVNDTTNGLYLKHVKHWLRGAKRSGVRLGSVRAVDKALAKELDELLYSGSLGVGYGQRLYWGVCHIWPDLAGNLPYARKSLATWESYDTVSENVPARKSTLTWVFDEMARAGQPEMGFIGHVALDGFLRSMDWDQLRGEDLYAVCNNGQYEVTLKFGRRHRGERSKVGSHEQGVKVASQWIAKILYLLKQQVGDEEKLFATSPAEFRRCWWTTLRRLGLEWIGPPHVIRHSGPSHAVSDEARGTSEGMTLEDTRRRGRWSQVKSVQRYTKSHDLIVHDSKLTPEQRSKAKGLRDGLPWSFFEAAVSCGNGHWTFLVMAASKLE